MVAFHPKITPANLIWFDAEHEPETVGPEELIGHELSPEQLRAIERMPWPLFKSLWDPWRYVVRLADGLTIFFDSAAFSDDAGEWLVLSNATVVGLPPDYGYRFLHRDPEIRVDQIAMVADMDS